MRFIRYNQRTGRGISYGATAAATGGVIHMLWIMFVIFPFVWVPKGIYYSFKYAVIAFAYLVKYLVIGYVYLAKAAMWMYKECIREGDLLHDWWETRAHRS